MPSTSKDLRSISSAGSETLAEQESQDALALIRQLPIELIPAEEDLIFAAAHIKANHPISYADAFVVAVAMQEDATILTADPEFRSVETLAHVEWL